MTRYNNTKPKGPQAVSYEGGAVYEKNIINEWINILFSSYMEDGFYANKSTYEKRFLELTSQIADLYGVSFIAKAAYFARNELGMRTASQLIAAWLNSQTFENKRTFYKRFMHRPDDVAEIFAMIDHFDNKRSHALIRGAADYLSSLSAYSLGKYKLQSRQYNMYDVINLTHAWSPAIQAYKNNALDTPETWEVQISTAADKEERDNNWKYLVENHKLGYMALIRNLNNILAIEDIDDKWIQTFLYPQIVDSTSIHKSLIFPYRIYNAYLNLKVRNISVIFALASAFKQAVKNMPVLNGTTGIILDVSGSMDAPISFKSNISIKEVGACFAVAIFLANPNTKIVKFGNTAKEVKLNKLGNPFDLVNQLVNNDGCGYSTIIEPAYKVLSNLNNKYDRIFIISDMQIMNSRNTYFFWENDSYNKKNTYGEYFNTTPVYSFDLGNYPTQVMPDNNYAYYLTSLNEQVFKFISILESGTNIIDYINRFNYY